MADRRRAEVEKVLAHLAAAETKGLLVALRAVDAAAGEREERDWATALW